MLKKGKRKEKTIRKNVEVAGRVVQVRKGKKEKQKEMKKAREGEKIQWRIRRARRKGYSKIRRFGGRRE